MTENQYYSVLIPLCVLCALLLYLYFKWKVNHYYLDEKYQAFNKRFVEIRDLKNKQIAELKKENKELKSHNSIQKQRIKDLRTSNFFMSGGLRPELFIPLDNSDFKDGDYVTQKNTGFIFKIREDKDGSNYYNNLKDNYRLSTDEEIERYENKKPFIPDNWKSVKIKGDKLATITLEEYKEALRKVEGPTDELNRLKEVISLYERQNNLK